MLAERCGAVALAMALAAGAQAQTYGNFRMTMASGGTLLLFHYANVHPDCTSVGPVEVRVLTAPSSGVVRTAQKAGYSRFNGDFVKCNTQKALGASVSYAPQKGFIGTDTVQLDVFYPGGLERVDTYTITVK